MAVLTPANLKNSVLSLALRYHDEIAGLLHRQAGNSWVEETEVLVRNLVELKITQVDARKPRGLDVLSGAPIEMASVGTFDLVWSECNLLPSKLRIGFGQHVLPKQKGAAWLEHTFDLRQTLALVYHGTESEGAHDGVAGRVRQGERL